MGLFRDFRDWRRYAKLPIEKKRILFYSEHAGYTNNFRPTMDLLVQKYGAHICYVTSDERDPMLACTDPNYTVLYTKGFLALLIGGLADKTVCVMTMPALDVYHIKRSKERVNYVYLFHSLMSASMTYQYRAFDYFDTVMCTGLYQVEEMRKTEELHHTKAKRLVEAGYTRLDDVGAEYEAFLKNPPKKSRPRILVAPSWGPNTMVEHHRDGVVAMMESILAEGYDVTLRYHPETVRRRKDVLDFFEEKFGQNPNVFIETSVATNQSMLEADVLISEWSSISLEYAFGTERPVIYVDTPRKIQNDQYEEIGITPFEVRIRNEIGRLVAPSDMEHIGKVAREMIENGSTWRDRIIGIRNAHIFHYRHAAEQNAAAIAALAEDMKVL